MTTMRFTMIESPLGVLLLAADDAGLRSILLPGAGGAASPEPDWREDRDALAEPARQLREYFAGGRRAFELTLAPRGTAFQRRVWNALLEIRYGETWSYGELARHIGSPAAPRAVGAANGANPIPIVVPCHRVIGSDGRLVGYGGGLDTKRKLLALESGQTALV